MIRDEYPGAWYGELFPDGRRIVSYPDGRLETEAGTGTFLGGLLYVRLHPRVGFVGVGAEGAGAYKDHAVECTTLIAPVLDRGLACGFSPCAYWPDGRLVISHCEPPYGSQGIRWIDTAIHTGDATYVDPSIPLWEFTTHGDVTVGQGGQGPYGEDPCFIVVSGVRHLLEPGTCRAIRFNRDGDALAIAMFRQDHGAHVAYRLTVAEVLTLPIYGAPPKPEPPKPEPPKPEEPMNKPIVTVDSWTLSDVLEGREMRFHDSGNPDLKIAARVWVSGGSMYASFTNKVGTAQTGLLRAVTPCSEGTPEPEPKPPEPKPPEPEPEPEPSTRFALQTCHGSYLCVGADHFLTQTGRPAVFEEVEQPNGTIGLRCNGKFIASESDMRLKADRETVSDWEYFYGVYTGDGGRAYQAWQGTYISAHDDGTVRADMRDVGGWETFTPEPVHASTRPPIVGPLSAGSGRIFYDTAGPWRWRGVSAFPLCRLHADGHDIQPFLEAFPGYNILRVWDYVTWPGSGWESCSVDQWRTFLTYVQQRGWYVELTLLTDDDRGRHAHAKDLALSLAGLVNLVLEIGNEPETHKNIDTTALRDACNRSGLLYSSGNYETSAHWFGRFGTAHTPRDPEWPRKGHDLMEYYGGGGPSSPSDPACKAPWVGDEPIRPDQCNPGWYAIDRDYQSYGGVCALLGAGATFHFEGGKFGHLPTPLEQSCAEAMRSGLEAFHPDAPNWGYRRIDEQGKSLRTYVLGDWCMVRVRPTTAQAPEPGWTPIDDWHQVWVK